MVQDHNIIIFLWSCDPYSLDHEKLWSNGRDLGIFMISWSWSGDYMIYSPKIHDPVISREIFFVIRWSLELIFLIHFVFNHLFLLIHYDHKPNWINNHCFANFPTIIINRNNHLLWLKANFRFLTLVVPKFSWWGHLFFVTACSPD